MPDALDPYAILEVSPSATPAEITHAYRQKLRSQHPDTRTAPGTDSETAADNELRQVLAAYAVLRDPARRAAYDHTTRTTTRSRPAVNTRDAQLAVDIPVTHNARRRNDAPHSPPLWVGPVRRHR